MKNLLCDNIKSLRTVRGISQIRLAEELNVTKQCVSNWENDNVQPSIDMLSKLADYFNVSTDYLLGRTAKKIVSLDGLTDVQAAHIGLIINDLQQLNQR